MPAIDQGLPVSRTPGRLDFFIPRGIACSEGGNKAVSRWRRRRDLKKDLHSRYASPVSTLSLSRVFALQPEACAAPVLVGKSLSEGTEETRKTVGGKPSFLLRRKQLQRRTRWWRSPFHGRDRSFQLAGCGGILPRRGPWKRAEKRGLPSAELRRERRTVSRVGQPLTLRCFNIISVYPEIDPRQYGSSKLRSRYNLGLTDLPPPPLPPPSSQLCPLN